MSFLHWLKDNWIEVLQSFGIIGSLLMTFFALVREGKSRRASSLIALTAHHRDIWREIYERPELSRILDPEADLQKSPVTPKERLFMQMLILHLNSAFHAIRAGVVTSPEKLAHDIGFFLSLPVPAAVWVEVKSFHDECFVKFVEGNRKNVPTM